jgi:hypothetical protein
MSTARNLGIWMDHSSAHLMEYSDNTIKTTIIESEFAHQDKTESLVKSEHLMHNKEQHQQASYYKDLGSIIRDYDAVLLFGPTDAKTELFNMLRADHLFAHIKIEVEQADKMTENQEHAFVKTYFSHNKNK